MHRCVKVIQDLKIHTATFTTPSTAIWIITRGVLTDYTTCTYAYIHIIFPQNRGHHLLNVSINPAIKTTKQNIASGIQIGEHTHHQLQFATAPRPANLSVRKMRNNTVPMPMPFDLLLSSLISCLIF